MQRYFISKLFFQVCAQLPIYINNFKISSELHVINLLKITIENLLTPIKAEKLCCSQVKYKSRTISKLL